MKQLSSHENSVNGNGGWSRTRIRAVALALLAGVGIYLCYRLAQPCIPSLVWAGALAMIFTPLQRWIEARVKSPSVAAAFSLVIIGLLVVAPTTWFAQKLVEQATSVPENIQKQIAAGKWHMRSDEHPLMAPLAARIERQVNSPENASMATAWLQTFLARLVKESAIAAVQACLTLYFLFYFLRDRVRVLKAIRSFLPLSESDTDTLFSRVNDTVHATLYGMLALSALQGMLGGLMFWWLGVPSPWFWALVAAVFAFVPVLDTFVLWLPAAVYLGLEGRWGEALVVAALGSLLVRGIENFLYPVLVKRRLRVPSVSIFVSLVGGLLLFGWSGLVLGPVILTVTSALFEICAKRFGEPQLGVQSADCPTSETLRSTDAEHRCVPQPTRIEIMKALGQIDGSPAVESRSAGTRDSIQSLLTVGIVVLITTFVSGAQPEPTNSGQTGQMTARTLNEIPTQGSDRSFEGFAPTVKKVAPAVVRIVTVLSYNNPAELTSGAQDSLRNYVSGQVPRVRSGLAEGDLGSGVIVTEDGYILTTSHLVAGASEVEVTLQDGRYFNAKVIGADTSSDIAVIKIDAHDLPTVRLADSRNVQVGDLVLAIGHPFGVGQTVTHGIVSATDRGGMGIEDYESFIQTDAPINPGNSGGALVDVTGQLIGINTAILSSSGGSLGIGFAVPSNLARRVMADLVMYGYVIRGYLGAETQDLTPGLAKEFKLHDAAGVLVGGVVHNGPAEQGGLKVGDVITRFDGKDVHDSRQLKLSVAESKPGQILPLEVVRDGSSRPLQITIRQTSTIDFLPKMERTAYEQNGGALQGVFIGELNTELRQKLKVPRDMQGAVVFDLHAYSTAAQAGLRPGDIIQSVNQQEIRSAGEACRVAENAKDKRTLLRVWSSGGSHFILIEE